MPEPTVSAQHRRRGKLNDMRGKHAQDAAEHALARAGFCFVEPIATPMALMPVPNWNRKPPAYFVQHKRKVSGDFAATCPGSAARAVHVEVKERGETNSNPNARLSLSDFAEHQLQQLQAKHEAGILALVAWVRLDLRRVLLLPWPIAGLAKGSPLRWEDAIPQELSAAPVCEGST